MREIKKAINNKDTILFVEYIGYGQTLPRLTNLTKHINYTKAYHIVKGNNDGSKEIKKFLTKHKLVSKVIKIIGVNTDFCVLETVLGINRKFPKSNINVIADACATNAGGHISALRNMKQLANVKLLRAPKL